jgi:hypothetical protein
MTTFPETTLITNFCPWGGFDIQFSPIPSNHNQTFDLFPQKGSDASSRRIMTDIAFDFTMGRLFPAFKIRFHVMTGSTKS